MGGWYKSPPPAQLRLGPLPSASATADTTPGSCKEGDATSKSGGKEVLGSMASRIHGEALLESGSEGLLDRANSLLAKVVEEPTSLLSGTPTATTSPLQPTVPAQTPAVEEEPARLLDRASSIVSKVVEEPTSLLSGTTTLAKSPSQPTLPAQAPAVEDTFVPHQSDRASRLAARHTRKAPDAPVESLRGAQVHRHHRHAIAYTRRLVDTEAPPSVPAEGKEQSDRVDLSVLDVPQMIQTLEGLARDEIPARYQDVGLRMVLLSTLSSTDSPTDAWDAYHLLTLLPNAHVPFAHLHRLVRLLSKQRPRTRRVFLRILSALTAVHARGGIVRRWEWNLLVDAAGKGTHRIHLEDFRTALAMFDDMRAGRAPGATFLSAGRAERVENRSFSPDDNGDDDLADVWGTFNSDARQKIAGARTADPEREPDIYTYTTLLSLATHTLDGRALHRMSNLGLTIPPNAVTHSVMLSLFARRGDWSAVRGALRRLGPLDQTAFGAVLWAFASAGRTDVAGRMHAVARACAGERERLGRALYDAERIEIQDAVAPDKGSYHALIQAYAYHGDLGKCLRTFQEMLTTVPHKPPASHNIVARGFRQREIRRTFAPTVTAFRAIFLGFYHHGTDSRAPHAQWTLARLLPVLAQFLALPQGARPRATLLFWILTALWRTSGRDAGLVLDAANKLRAKFGGGWTGRLENMRAMLERVVSVGERVNITRRERWPVDEEGGTDEVDEGEQREWHDEWEE